VAKLSRWAVFLRVFLVTLVAGQAGRSGAAEPPEIRAWEVATTEGTAAAYYGYLAQYPAGEYVDQAIRALIAIGAIQPDATRQITPRTGARRTPDGSTTVPASDDASGDDVTVYP
jgi:hypothetical protein